MEMINTLLEKEGEGKRERKRMVWGDRRRRGSGGRVRGRDRVHM